MLFYISLSILILLIIYCIILLKNSREFNLFSYYNKKAIREYEFAVEKVKNGEGNTIVHKLQYTDLKYKGVKVENNKRVFMYTVIHPYEFYLKDKKSFHVSLKNWEQNAESFRIGEKYNPPPGVSDYQTKIQSSIETPEKIEPIYNPWIFSE